MSTSERPGELNKAPDEGNLLSISGHIEEGYDAEGRKVRRRGIYLLSNLFTMAVLFFGFYATTNGMSGQFANAATAIFVVMVLDGLDGHVAHLTNTQSALSAEYDSLSDMATFGVASALVAFEWVFGSLGRVGRMVTFTYVMGAALRLARFNTQVGKADKRYSTGLANPAAVALVAGTVQVSSDFGVRGAKVAFLVTLLVVAANVLIVNNVKYHSFKNLDLRGRMPFVAILIVVLTFAVAFTDPPRILLLLPLAYAASGPVQYPLQLRRRKQPS